LPERLRLESREPQIVWPLAAHHTREIGRHRVFLARQVGFDQVAGDGRILRGQTMRFVERRNRLVELTELLIREPEMRQQKAELERRIVRRPELDEGGRQRIDNALILSALFERFGERGEAPGTPDVLRDEGAGGRLRA